MLIIKLIDIKRNKHDTMRKKENVTMTTNTHTTSDQVFTSTSYGMETAINAISTGRNVNACISVMLTFISIVNY